MSHHTLRAIALASLMVFSVIAMSGAAVGEIVRGGANAQYDVVDETGDVGSGAVVFQGEDDITFTNDSSTGSTVNAAELRRSNDVGGETLAVPIPQDQPTGQYNDRIGFNVTVDTPRITTFDVNNNNTDINGGTLTAGQTGATVDIVFNFENSERIDLAIEDSNDVDVTNEFTSANTTINASVANNVPEVDNSAGSVTIPFDPSGVDEGEYNFTAEGDDDFDFGEASQSTTIAVTTPQSQGQVDIDPSDLPGDGSSQNPYKISNASELQAMENSLTSSYKLVSDIDASQTPQFNNGSGFDPIGLTGTPFSGSFDGDNHTITGLTINRPGESDVGLFGVTGDGATLTNVALTNTAVTGGDNVGGLAGENSGTIQNVSASGSVTGSDTVGGVVGQSRNGGIITDVRSSVDVSGTDTVGGLVGQNSESNTPEGGIIANATALGSVTGDSRVGGLVGENEEGGTIRDTFAVGAVTGDTSVGGLVGDNDFRATVEDSYFDKQTTGQSISAGSATGLATAQMQGQAAYFNLIGLDFLNSWTISNEYPVLRSQSEEFVVIDDNSNLTKIDIAPDDLNGDGSSQNPYEISNASELQAMEDSLTANYVLVSDINATESAQFTDGRFDPIGSTGTPFSGSFDGDNHTITGLTINRPDEGDVGLFTVTGNGATLTNVTLVNATVTGGDNVGGLAGENSGTIQNVSASGSVTGSDTVGGVVGQSRTSGIITDSRSSVDVSGTDTVGGLVGQNSESNTPEGGIIANATALGSVTGDSRVGGLVGENEEGGTIRDTFAVGAVTGDTSVGGLVGDNDRLATVEDSYFDRQTTGQSASSGSATALATAQMQGQAAIDNMSGLAFGTSWQPQTQPNDYPALIALQEVDTTQQPIITLQSIEANRTAVTDGQTVKLTATVSNNGATDSTTQLAVIRNRDNQQLAESSSNIPGGATRTISVNVTPSQTEKFSIQGPASTRSVTIDVAELNLVDASLSTQEPVTTDETVIVDATVSNTGTTAGFIPLTLAQNGVVLNVTDAREVPAGETVTVQLTGSLDEGTRNLTITSGLIDQSATVGDFVVAPPEEITNATVDVGSGSVGPEGTATVNLTLDQAPAGLAGYNLTASVTVAQTSGVTVTDATAPGVFNNSVTETEIGANNQTVEIRAADIETKIEPNETNISLGTVTVGINESVNVSQLTFTVSVSRIDDNTGTPINVTTQNGTVRVGNQVPLAEGLAPPTDTDGDGVFEDINGNERLDFNDIVVLFENLPDAEAPFQDVNGNGRIDFDDIVELFKEI